MAIFKMLVTGVVLSASTLVQAELLFLDRFEYTANRTDSNKTSLFQQQGGWSGFKDLTTSNGAAGYLYTAPSVPGYSGQFPGVNSSRVLVLESLAATLQRQTDFYLQYGNSESSNYTNHVPGNVWFQFWIYPNRYGNQQTAFHGREKFIYPCNGAYPCNSGKWLLELSSSSYEPFNASSLPTGGAYLLSRDNQVGTVTYSLAEPWDANKLGQTDIDEYISPNRWTLVKIHYDTTGQNGAFEAWIRPRGGNWVKVAEWIGGVTPNFSWTIPSEHQGGHRAFRIPTTMPGNNTTPLYDAWLYIDDFAVASSEDSLPVYNDGGAGTVPPAPPTTIGVRTTQ